MGQRGLVIAECSFAGLLEDSTGYRRHHALFRHPGCQDIAYAYLLRRCIYALVTLIKMHVAVCTRASSRTVRLCSSAYFRLFSTRLSADTLSARFPTPLTRNLTIQLVLLVAHSRHLTPRSSSYCVLVFRVISTAELSASLCKDCIPGAIATIDSMKMAAWSRSGCVQHVANQELQLWLALCSEGRDVLQLLKAA